MIVLILFATNRIAYLSSPRFGRCVLVSLPSQRMLFYTWCSLSKYQTDSKEPIQRGILRVLLTLITGLKAVSRKLLYTPQITEILKKRRLSFFKYGGWSWKAHSLLFIQGGGICQKEKKETNPWLFKMLQYRYEEPAG